MKKPRLVISAGALLSLALASSVAFALDYDSFTTDVAGDQADLEVEVNGGYSASGWAQAVAPSQGHNGETKLNLNATDAFVLMQVSVRCGTQTYYSSCTASAPQTLKIVCGSDLPPANEWSASIKISSQEFSARPCVTP